MLGAFEVTPSHRDLGGYKECTFYFLNAYIGMHVGIVCVRGLALSLKRICNFDVNRCVASVLPGARTCLAWSDPGRPSPRSLPRSRP